MEAERVIEHAKKKLKAVLKAVCEEALGEIYIDCASHIESDSWTNFRNELMDGFRDYRNSKVQGKYDFKQIRLQIFNDFRAEILADLDQDNLEKIVELEKQIKHLQEMLRYR